LRYVYLFVFDFRYNRTSLGSFLGVERKARFGIGRAGAEERERDEPKNPKGRSKGHNASLAQEARR